MAGQKKRRIGSLLTGSPATPAAPAPADTEAQVKTTTHTPSGSRIALKATSSNNSRSSRSSRSRGGPAAAAVVAETETKSFSTARVPTEIQVARTPTLDQVSDHEANSDGDSGSASGKAAVASSKTTEPQAALSAPAARKGSVSKVASFATTAVAATATASVEVKQPLAAAASDRRGRDEEWGLTLTGHTLGLVEKVKQPAAAAATVAVLPMNTTGVEGGTSVAVKPKLKEKSKANSTSTAKESAGGNSSSRSSSRSINNNNSMGVRGGSVANGKVVLDRSTGGHVSENDLFGLPCGEKCSIDVLWEVELHRSRQKARQVRYFVWKSAAHRLCTTAYTVTDERYAVPRVGLLPHRTTKVAPPFATCLARVFFALHPLVCRSYGYSALGSFSGSGQQIPPVRRTVVPSRFL